MMQQLLRGRVLYVVLGLLTVSLYLWLRPVIRVTPSEVVSSESRPSVQDRTGAGQAVESDSLEWWPEDLDRAAFQRLAMKQPRLAILLSVLTAWGMGLGLAGLMLLVGALRNGRIRSVWRFAPHRLPPWSFGELGRITLLLLVVTLLLPFIYFASRSSGERGVMDPHLRITVSMMVLDVCTALIILAFAVGKGRTVWRTFGFSRRKLTGSIAVGLRSYVGVFPWLFILLLVTAAVFQALGLKPPREPIQELVFQEHRPLVLGLMALLTCAIGPIAEEFFFRGVVYPAIRQRTSWMVATLVSGTLFALLHANPIGFPSILLLGCLLTNLYERTGSLAGPLAVHVLHNTFLISAALVFRQVLAVS